MKNDVHISLEGLADSQLLSDLQAASILGVKPGTLAVWRCTGRYDLPYIKVGRLVRYRVGDLRDFIARRSFQHTGG